MKHVAPLRYGVIFEKAFSQPDIFTAFVKAMLGIELQIDHVETEKAFVNPIGNVNSRFDLFAEDKTNRIIVDIQHRRYDDHYHRFLHYHCAALLEQSVTSKSYRPDLAVYTIVVLTSGDRHGRDMLTIDFDPKDRDGVAVGEIPHKILYVCPKYVDEDTPEPWREWLLAIDDSLDGQVDETQYKNACIQKVFELITQDTLSPKEHARMKDEYSKETWLKEQTNEARQKEKLAIAKNLLDILDNETIALKTGLAITDIQHLRKQS
jgi:hypothetical protein